MPKTASLATAAFFAIGTALLAGCNNETPPAKVGSGAGPTDNTGAPSGRVTTQDEAKQTGGNQ